MNILFVDDEPAILRTIRRTLRNLPPSHQVDLESDPAAALARLRETPYQLVVTDMRMPGCSGAQILETAAQQHPDCVRAVLSGYSGEEETAQVVPHAHLFIAKPFEPKDITELLARAEALSAMPLSETLRRRLGGLKALPAVPRLFTTLTRALSDQNHQSSVADIASILSSDLALTAKLLQLANSAFFGGGARVTRVEQAVQILGTRMLTGLVLQHELFVNGTMPPPLINWRERLNQESMITADLASQIARQLRLDAATRDETAMAALLHDVGRIVLVTELYTQEGPENLPTECRGDLICQEEEARLGTHHGWVGAYLLRLWGLPPTLVDAVAWHHQPSRSGISGLSTLTLVHVADALTCEEKSGVACLDLEYLRAVGCEDRLPAWKELAAAAVKQPPRHH